MSALTLTLKQETAQRVDMSPLVCQLLKDVSIDDIAAIELQNGKRKIPVGELFDISGDKMQLILDFPTVGEPHYAQGIAADVIMNNSKQIYKLEENMHPHAIRSEEETKVVREGNVVRIYMTSIRSHFAPDNIEGIKVGDEVYFHVTNLEQEYDVPHGFAVMGARTSELLIMPGQTETLLWRPQYPGVIPFYCSDFCSALHQEMQGYIRVSAQNTSPEIKWSVGTDE